MDFFFGYRESKIKPYLKMASQRLMMAQNKKRNAVKVQKREIAVLLNQGKEESARIKIEHTIRQDYEIESYELIQLYCELVLERIRLVTHDTTCPHELLVPISTIIWCADRIDVEELITIKRQLYLKYGSEFIRECASNDQSMVSDKVVSKLSIQPPSAYLIQEYLKEVAKEYSVSWSPRHNILPDDPAYASPRAGLSSYSRLPPPPSDVMTSSQENIDTQGESLILSESTLDTHTNASPTYTTPCSSISTGMPPAMDDLQARLAALKQSKI